MKLAAILTVFAGAALAPSAESKTAPMAKWCAGEDRCPRPPLTKRERAIRADRRAHRRTFRHWSRQYIPSCTWYGESGPGPQFARWRYSVPNSSGSGAYGKYQMMPGTYSAFARFHDWSRADQERAAHLLYLAQGTSPWEAC